jgi:hypothetical protein
MEFLKNWSANQFKKFDSIFIVELKCLVECDVKDDKVKLVKFSPKIYLLRRYIMWGFFFWTISGEKGNISTYGALHFIKGERKKFKLNFWAKMTNYAFNNGHSV